MRGAGSKGRGRTLAGHAAWLLALAALASACVVTATVPPSRGILVSGPPPAIVREERPPPPPAPHASWITGYWHWTGIQYAWIPGHWEAAPPMGTTWRAPLYVQNNGAYFYEPGGWAPSVQRVAPPAASVNAEAFH
jgi:hypothetical protein